MDIEGIRLDERGRIAIPETKKRIKFDVGLSWCAPNSALWLTEEDDLFVIGIEPNRDALKSIKDKGAVWNPRQSVDMTEENYMLLECAIDNVEELTSKKFYAMEGDPGTSSLLEPAKKLTDKQGIDNTDEVTVVPFKEILERLPWERFEYIDMVKTDCQGIDMEVIKSMGEYLDKVVYLNVELTTYGHYINETNTNAFLTMLREKGFQSLGGELFVNTKLKDKIAANNVSGKCLGL